MQQPLVSILIPFKNTAEYLPECINSIQNQSYTNWELIAINDSSTDNSLEIMNAYASKESRINVYTNTGSGIIEALRMAYLHCKGDFITRMDSDDIMTPNKLEIMLKSLLEHGKKHIAVGQVSYFSAKGISNGYERYEKWLNKLTAIGNNYTEIYKECTIPSPCWMVYKEDFENSGGFTPNRYPEDYDLAFRFYENNLQCIPCNEKLHLWRDYDTRTSRTSEHYAQNYFLDIKAHYFLKLNYDVNRPLVVWGAGNKGKSIAKMLLNKNIAFYWLCDNENKIGKDIYGKKMQHYTTLEQLQNCQTIITVANEEAQTFIKDYLSNLKQINMKDYFFFC